MKRHARGGMRGGSHDARVVFFYGFPKGMTQDQFLQSILEPFGGAMDLLKTDYLAHKLMAFVHTKTHGDAQSLITQWNRKALPGSEGGKTMQVRFKTNDPGANNYGGQQQSMGGGFGGNTAGPEAKKARDLAAISLPGEYGKQQGRSFQPKAVEGESHNELGYSKQYIRISGFEPDTTQNDAIDILAIFGPIHTFYAQGYGNFIVRYCYDLCNEFMQKHIVDMGDESPLFKNQKFPAGLEIERVDDVEDFV